MEILKSDDSCVEKRGAVDHIQQGNAGYSRHDISWSERQVCPEKWFFCSGPGYVCGMSGGKMAEETQE